MRERGQACYGRACVGCTLDARLFIQTTPESVANTSRYDVPTYERCVVSAAESPRLCVYTCVRVCSSS